MREEFAYGMPAYKLNGKPLVYFAAYKKHIGFYATPTGHAAFSDEFWHINKLAFIGENPDTALKH